MLQDQLLKYWQRKLFDDKSLVCDHKHCLKEEEIDFILKVECKGSSLYGLPRVHKSREIKSAVDYLQSEYVNAPLPPGDLKFYLHATLPASVKLLTLLLKAFDATPKPMSMMTLTFFI